MHRHLPINNRLLKSLYILVCSLAIVGVTALPSYAADTGVVTATVTAQNIAITVSDGSVAYGTIAVDSTADTTGSSPGDTQTATNTGNVTANFDIKGQDSANWTLGGTAGSETYTHKFCTTDCDGSPTWTALTTSYQDLANSVAGDSVGTQDFDLQIGTPTSTSNYSEQTVSVTVLVTTS